MSEVLTEGVAQRAIVFGMALYDHLVADGEIKLDDRRGPELYLAVGLRRGQAVEAVTSIQYGDPDTWTRPHNASVIMMMDAVAADSDAYSAEILWWLRSPAVTDWPGARQTACVQKVGLLVACSGLGLRPRSGHLICEAVIGRLGHLMTDAEYEARAAAMMPEEPEGEAQP